MNARPVPMPWPILNCWVKTINFFQVIKAGTTLSSFGISLWSLTSNEARILIGFWML